MWTRDTAPPRPGDPLNVTERATLVLAPNANAWTFEGTNTWLLAEPGILIFDNPTQGVDVGAKEEIYDIIHALAKEGVAVVVLSSEVQEIMRLCDRAYVLYHGEVRGELTNKEMTERRIMLLATGGN